jgi:hypothetical protein
LSKEKYEAEHRQPKENTNLSQERRKRIEFQRPKPYHSSIKSIVSHPITHCRSSL